MRPFSQSLPMALLQAREVTMRRFRPMLGRHDLTEQQWRVLRALMAEDDPIDAGHLAARTFLLAPSLSRILSDLEQRGLIERQVDPRDHRRSLSSLSERGYKQVEAVAPLSEHEYARIEAEFGTDRLDALLCELHDFVEILDAEHRVS